MCAIWFPIKTLIFFKPIVLIVFEYVGPFENPNGSSKAAKHTPRQMTLCIWEFTDTIKDSYALSKLKLKTGLMNLVKCWFDQMILFNSPAV